MSRRWLLLALLAYTTISILLTGPALFGQGSLVPEGLLDRDQLFMQSSQAGLRPFGDGSPMVLELGRERAVASGLQHGRIATWNPWSGAGAPLWAEQGGPFFPTNLIYYLYPHHSTRMAALSARLVVAALGMFFLARALGLSPWVALFSGALFEFSGNSRRGASFATSSAIYMFPWVLLGAQSCIPSRGLVPWRSAGLALGVASLGGHPSFILLTIWDLVRGCGRTGAQASAIERAQAYRTPFYRGGVDRVSYRGRRIASLPRTRAARSILQE